MLYRGRRPQEWSQYSNVTVNEVQIEEVGFSISQWMLQTAEASPFSRREPMLWTTVANTHTLGSHLWPLPPSRQKTKAYETSTF
jgi:hypothetical protein